MDRLTKMQMDFVNHFVEHGNAAKAARLAGCGKGERVTSCRWMKQPKIRRAIEQRQQVARLEAGVSTGKLIDAAMATYREAKMSGRVPARLRALKLVAKLSGIKC